MNTAKSKYQTRVPNPGKIRVMAAINESCTLGDAAELLGVSRQVLDRWRRDLGLPLRAKGRRSHLPKDDVRLIDALIGEGLTDKVIAEKFEVTTQTVSGIRRRGVNV